METLEKRLAPAGIITAVLTGGALKLTGDQLDNAVRVEEVGPNTFLISGLDGTVINFGAVSNAASVTVKDVSKSIALDLKEGSDELTLQDITFGGGITVQLGAGDNEVALESLDLGGALTITGGKDADVVTGSSLHIGGLTKFNLGEGSNSVVLTSTGAEIFGAGLIYSGGAGTDVLTANVGSLMVGGKMDIKMGKGDSTVSLNATGTAAIHGAVTHVDQGAVSKFEITGNVVSIGGGLTVTHGVGDNTTTLSAAELIEISGDVSITNGNTHFVNTTKIQAASVNLGGDLKVTGGAGDNVNTFQGAIVVEGKVTVTNGNGSATTSFNGASLQVGEGLAVTNKMGAYETTITSARVDVAGALAIVTGGTAAAPSSGTTTVTVSDSLHAGALTITNGVGNFINTFGSGDAHVSGSLIIKNGDTTRPAGAGVPAGTTTTMIEGVIHVGGHFSITNGNGAYFHRFNAGLATPSSLYVGGGLSVTAGTHFGGDFGLNLDSLTVKGGLTLKNGNDLSGNGTHAELHCGRLFVGGAVTVTNGNAGTDGVLGNYTLIEATSSANLGSLVVKNGTGNSRLDLDGPSVTLRGGMNVSTAATNHSTTTVNVGSASLNIGGGVVIAAAGSRADIAITGAALRIGGSISVASGNGGDVLIGDGDSLFVNGNIGLNLKNAGGFAQIGDDAASSVRVQGSISLTAPNQGGELRVYGDGRIAGGVRAVFGGNLDVIFAVNGREAADGTGMHVAGAISLTAGVNTARLITLVHGSFGSVNFAGGDGHDQVQFTNAALRGHVMLDLKGGIDHVAIDDVNVRGNLTILTGHGNDNVFIESSTIFTGASVFQGAVKIEMGADDDGLTIVQSGHSARKAAFHASVVLDGGTFGMGNTLEIGAVAAFDSPPTLKNF